MEDVMLVVFILVVLGLAGWLLWAHSPSSDGQRYVLKCGTDEGFVVQELIVGFPEKVQGEWWKYYVSYEEAPRYFIADGCTLKPFGVDVPSSGGRKE